MQFILLFIFSNILVAALTYKIFYKRIEKLEKKNPGR